MTTKIKLYPASKIDARIALLHKTGQRMQTEMHAIACSVLRELGSSKDVRQVMKFVQAMPEMARSNGLRNWFEQFGPVKFITEGEGPAVVERAIYIKTGPTKGGIKLGDAIAKPFWKFSDKEGQPYEAIDMQKWAAATIKKLEKDAKETGRDHTALIHALKYANMTGSNSNTLPDMPATEGQPFVAIDMQKEAA